MSFIYEYVFAILMPPIDSIFILLTGIVGSLQFQLPWATRWQELVNIFSLIQICQEYIYQLCIIKPLSFNRFKQNYEHYIIRGTDKNATDREQRIGSTVAKVMIQFEYAWEAIISGL